MITFCSINEIEAANQALMDLKTDYQNLYQKLVEMVNLTRALNFKFQYMGALIMEEDPGRNSPTSVHNSVLQLYKKEMQFLKHNHDFKALKEILSEFKDTGYSNICLLILGMKPESLVGPSYAK